MKRSVIALGVAATMSVLVGCGAGSDDGGGESSDAAAAPNSTANEGSSEDEGDVGEQGSSSETSAKSASGSGVITDAVQAAAGRDIIYTIDVQMEVDDVPRAARDTSTIAIAAGGFVSSEEATTDHATVTLRIPTTAQTEVLNQLEGLGKVTDRSRSTQDVTQEVVDTDSRISSQRASIARIRQLLDNAADLDQVIDIESELAQREADLDALLSRKEELSALTSMATITATFYEPAVVHERDVDRADTGFLAGLRNGWDAFVTAGAVLLTIVGALLPFVAVAGLIAIPTLMIVRQRRRLARSTG